MNILFNASQCGLGNNGGTKTIIRCAETLQDMEHCVRIEASTNNYTWHTPTGKYTDNIISSRLPPRDSSSWWDAIVFVSVWEIPFYIEDVKNISYNKYFWYMRGWEKWVKGEEWLIQQIKKFVAAGGRIIVNSSWLIDQLYDKCHINGVLCYSGLDIDFWTDKKARKDDKANWPSYDIGTMAYQKHKTKRTDLMYNLLDWCKAGKFNKKTTFSMFPISIGHTQDTMRMEYSTAKMWFLPTELEGFSQVGTEAGLCGSLLICNRMDSNGCKDFATDETAMRYDTWDELIECIENPDFSKVPLMQSVLREKIGNREDNMRKFIEILEGEQCLLKK